MDDVEFIQGQAESFITPQLYDTVIYTASTANANEVRKQFDQGVRGIVNGPVRIIQAVRPKHFIYLSSSMVYGDFHGMIPRETDPLDPVDPYGILKASSEQLVRFYCDEYDIPYTIIRPSAVYGPRDKIQRVLSKFIQAGMEDEELIVRGDQSLDFTYIDDLVQGIMLCVNRGQALNQTFNMTRGEAIPLFNAAALVIKHLKKGRITTEEHDELYPTRGALDISKAKHLLGYNPTVSLNEGIKRYIKEWI